MQKINIISGFLIFLSFLITVFSYFFYPELYILSGVLAWISLFLLFSKTSNKKLLVSLLVLSMISFIFSFLNGFDIDFKRAILVNQYLLVLLIGVGFLRLIASPKETKIKDLPRGKNSFLKTYFGVHLFGSVINLSSFILVADKLYKKASLTKLQVLVLSRAFSSDAFWSPFFVAFAAALTYAPNLKASTILPLGIVLAIIAFVITYLEVLVKYDFKDFQGYPINFESLYIPFLLALFVLITNHYFPNLKVILLIAVFSLLLTILILPLKEGLKNSYKLLDTHIKTELPNMKNELSLFLVAGLFGVSISSIIVGLNIDFPLDKFDGMGASILLLVFILLSFIGIHPIITIAIIGNWINELNHTLLAVTFLMSWSIAVSTSPFSGLNLTIQSRYKLIAWDIFKINLPYTMKMYFVCVIILNILAKYLGI